MTKEQLREYRDIKLERDDLWQQIQALEKRHPSLRSPRLDGMPRGGSAPSNPTEAEALKHAERWAELWEVYNQKDSELAAALLAIETAIKPLKPKYRRILRLYYAEGLTWEQVCAKTNYSERQIHRIHGAALEALRTQNEGETTP